MAENPIVFVTRKGDKLLSVQPDGSNLTPLQTATAPDVWDNPAVGPPQIAAFFFQNSDSSSHLKTMGRDGGGLAELTGIPPIAELGLYCPFDYSADGTHLALPYTETTGSFVSGIAIANADNSGFTKVPIADSGTDQAVYIAPDGAVRWSPDGSKFAYNTSPAVGGLAVAYCQRDGSGQTVVKFDITSGIDWYLYDWFADSAHLLLAKWDGTVSGTVFPTTLYKVALDGTLVSTLYDDTTGHTLYYDGINPGNEFHRSPALSPDNTQVAVPTTTGMSMLDVGSGVLTSIYTGSPTGPNLTATRVSWDPPPPSSIAAGEADTGVVRLG